MPVHTCPSIKARVVTRIEKRAFAERKTMARVQSDNAMLAYLGRALKMEKAEPGGARINESTWLLLTRPGSKGKDNWEISGGTQRSNRASKARVPIVKVRSLCTTQHASSRSTSVVNTAGKQAMVVRLDTSSALGSSVSSSRLQA